MILSIDIFYFKTVIIGGIKYPPLIISSITRNFTYELKILNFIIV